MGDRRRQPTVGCQTFFKDFVAFLEVVDTNKLFKVYRKFWSLIKLSLSKHPLKESFFENYFEDEM